MWSLTSRLSELRRIKSLSKKKDEADRDEIAEVKELLAEQKEEEAAVEKADKQPGKSIDG